MRYRLLLGGVLFFYIVTYYLGNLEDIGLLASQRPWVVGITLITSVIWGWWWERLSTWHEKFAAVIGTLIGSITSFLPLIVIVGYGGSYFFAKFPELLFSADNMLDRAFDIFLTTLITGFIFTISWLSKASTSWFLRMRKRKSS